MKLVLIILASVATANASEICEISTKIEIGYPEDVYPEFVRVNCTDWKVLQSAALIYGDGVRISDRVKLKKILVGAGYGASPTCGAYESFIRP